jgi:hypothetical protein
VETLQRQLQVPVAGFLLAVVIQHLHQRQEEVCLERQVQEAYSVEITLQQQQRMHQRLVVVFSVLHPSQPQAVYLAPHLLHLPAAYLVPIQLLRHTVVVSLVPQHLVAVYLDNLPLVQVVVYLVLLRLLLEHNNSSNKSLLCK